MTRVTGRDRGYGGVWLGLVVLLTSLVLSTASPLRTLEKRATGFSATVMPWSRPACAHKGDAVNSVAARAYMASTVFEGKARSRSPARKPSGLYGVTFVVQRVHKDKSAIPLKQRSPVRLQFREARGPEPGPSNICQQSYNFTRREPVKANIKRGRKYIVFVTGVGPHNFSVLGEPVLHSPKNLQAVKNVLCHNCFRPASVNGLQNKTKKTNEVLRLTCRCKGNPLPAIAWYKDGVSITVSSRTKILFKKKRSSLLIPKLRLEDAGKYECRATTVTGTQISSWATVTVKSVDNTTTLWPMREVECPVPTSYCLNGGTCTYFEAVGEMVCHCAEGFKGQRCENKDVYNRSSMYRPMSYFCKLGISSSYYC